MIKIKIRFVFQYHVECKKQSTFLNIFTLHEACDKQNKLLAQFENAQIELKKDNDRLKVRDIFYCLLLIQFSLYDKCLKFQYENGL